MKCEACLGMMEDLIEGELDDSLAREVAAHIAMCGPCSQLYANLRYEQEVYGKYLLDVEPTPALWTNLRLEMDKEKSVRASQSQLRLQRWLAIVFGSLRLTPQLATALVLLTIGLAIGITVWRTTNDPSMHQAQNPGVAGVQALPEVNRQVTHPESDDTDRRSSTNDNDRTIRPSSTGSNRRRGTQVNAAGSARRHIVERSPAAPTVDQVARKAEQEYLSAIEILSRDIKRRQAVISPALLSQFERALTEVDRNIAATRRVAHEQPRDPFAVQYLSSAYEKKVELLREVTSW